MARNYIINSWNNAAAGDYSGEQIGKRRRNGGGSTGFIHDRATDDVYPESILYDENGKANVQLFTDEDRLNTALETLTAALKRRSMSLDDIDDLSAMLESIKLNIGVELYGHYHAELESKREKSFLATLDPLEKKEYERERLYEYVKESPSSFPYLALEMGLPLPDEVLRQMGIKKSGAEWLDLVKFLAQWGIIGLVIVYLFYFT